MTSGVSDTDIIVIGAGAAGIAAARTLADAQSDFVVMEARQRVGGRGYTIEAGGYALDLGCGWLHSADESPFPALAEGLGLNVDRSEPPWQKPALEAGFPLAEQRAFRDALGAFYDRFEVPILDGQDRRGADFLEPECRWNAMIDAGSTYVNGAELDAVSTIDVQRYRDTEVNYRVVSGMGAMLAQAALGLPLVMGCTVTAIDRSGARLVLETSRGTMCANAVIVTIPSDLIATGAIRITPDLPDTRDAAARVPLGLADKLFLRLDDVGDFPVEQRLYGARDTVAMASYHLRPFGRPVIEAYFGGRFARELEDGGMAAFADYAIADIAGVLGNDMRRKLHPLACSAWARDPLARGSYSHALPGFADAHEHLARPVDDRLFFAGEATSRPDYSTAHGAWRTGIRAAREALAALR